MKELIVASTSKHKLEAVYLALQGMVRPVMARFPDIALDEVKVLGVDAVSGVNEQPYGLEETFIGAKNRAHYTLYPPDTLVLGIESGIIPIISVSDQRFLDIAIVYGRRNGWTSVSTSSGIEISTKYVAQAMATGFKESAGSFFVKDVGHGEGTDFTAAMMEGTIKRRDTLIMAIQTVLWKYLFR